VNRRGQTETCPSRLQVLVGFSRVDRRRSVGGFLLFGLATLGVAALGSGGFAQLLSERRGASFTGTPKAVTYIKASNTKKESQFGYAIALSGDGNTLAVGARFEASAASGIDGNQSDKSAPGAGAVYVFSRRGKAWSQQAYIKASNAGADNQFGSALALSNDGDTLAVGSLFEDSAATGINGDQGDNSAENSGAVYVFNRNGTTWSQQAYVKASNTKADDQFGYSLALSGDGNTLAVGAVGEDSSATGIDGNQADQSVDAAGAVYVFTRSGKVWSQQAYVKGEITGSGFMFGYSVGLNADGNTLTVGAYDETKNKGVNEGEGAVYVFSRSGKRWSQQAHLEASNAERGDSLGCSIAISADGNTIAAGAFDEDSLLTGVQPADAGAHDRSTDTSAGAAYVFVRNGSTWTQQAFIKASNARKYAQFGWALALSRDGNTLAVGAHLEGSGAKGVNGNQADDSAPEAGAVYLLTRSGNNWAQQAYLKASNTRPSSEFGISVALDTRGAVLAVGAHFESSSAMGINGNQADQRAKNAGAAYVYQ
jgi:trimeric autotransporter adhesin